MDLHFFAELQHNFKIKGLNAPPTDLPCRWDLRVFELPSVCGEVVWVCCSCASPQSGNNFIEGITAANHRGIIKPVIPAPPLEERLEVERELQTVQNKGSRYYSPGEERSCHEQGERRTACALSAQRTKDYLLFNGSWNCLMHLKKSWEGRQKSHKHSPGLTLSADPVFRRVFKCAYPGDFAQCSFWMGVWTLGLLFMRAKKSFTVSKIPALSTNGAAVIGFSLWWVHWKAFACCSG